jgi:hypothetical protein
MDTFEQLEQTIRTEGQDAAFELLLRRAREEGRYRDVFATRLMQARRRMGLPLIETEPAVDLPDGQRAEYEKSLQDAARETGDLFLARGDIISAWPYFRALGETAPVSAALENATGTEHLDGLIDIAFREQVNPRRGFELILEHRGICNAITWFGAMPEGESRRECLRLLVRNLYTELAHALQRHIAKVEGSAPGTESVAELIAEREWLFGENNYHVDTTHLTSVLRFSADLEDQASMRMALEMADYGARLAPMYHYRSDPPFDDPYRDHGAYLRTLLGQDVESGVEHFRAKAVEGAQAGYMLPAEIFIDLLVRLDRFDEAIAASVDFFPETGAPPTNCPSALQLCQIAGKFDRLRSLARQRGDLLAYTAALIQSQSV